MLFVQWRSVLSRAVLRVFERATGVPLSVTVGIAPGGFKPSEPPTVMYVYGGQLGTWANQGSAQTQAERPSRS
jgi:dipeptidyl aminopeptidase/acylaminoacyl peptidase